MVNLGKLPLHYVSADPAHSGPVLVDHNGLKIISCQKCGYRHQFPLPDPAIVTRHYAAADTFYRDSDGWFRKERAEHEQGLWNPMYQWQAGLLRSTRPERAFGTPLVDLGTGAGWFVKFWQDTYSARAVGVEPSRTARSYSPCPQLIEPSLKMAAKRFRVNTSLFIRAALVLEHLPDPVGFLREGLAAFPGCAGVMVIVPNEWNPLQMALNRRLASDRRYWWLAKDHLNYFDPAGLRRVMEAAGLSVQFIGVTCPVEGFHFLGFPYIGNEEVGKKVHRLRLRLERLPGTFALYQWLFRRWGWGRELVAIGVPNALSD